MSVMVRKMLKLQILFNLSSFRPIAHTYNHLHTHTPATHIHLHEIALIKGLPPVVYDGDDGQQPILANQRSKWSPMTPHQSAGCQQAFSQPTSPASYEYKKQLK